MALAERFSAFNDKIKEQEWYQQLQSSYQQMSPEQQQYVKWGALGTIAVVFLYLTLSVFTSANSLKSEYFEKQELLQLVNQAGDEIRRLKGQNAGIGQGGAQTWRAVVDGWVTSQGLQSEAAEILKESPGASQSMIQESLLEVQIKGITLRPLVQMLFQVEHGTPPAKLKGLQIENAGEGLLNVKMNLSGFMPKPEKK